MPKITKADMIDEINEVLAKEGKRLGNISKLKVEDLKALCVKYNVDMDKGTADREADKKRARQEAKVKAELERQERKEWLEKRDLEWKATCEEERQKKEEYNNFSDKVKDKLLDMYLEYNKNDIEQKKLNNIEHIKEVDLLEQTYKDKGILVLRPFPTTLVIKGIHIQYGALEDEEIDIKGYTYNWNKDYYFRYKDFIKVYEECFKVKVVIIGNEEIEIF